MGFPFFLFNNFFALYSCASLRYKNRLFPNISYLTKRSRKFQNVDRLAVCFIAYLSDDDGFSLGKSEKRLKACVTRATTQQHLVQNNTDTIFLGSHLASSHLISSQIQTKCFQMLLQEVDTFFLFHADRTRWS